MAGSRCSLLSSENRSSLPATGSFSHPIPSVITAPHNNCLGLTVYRNVPTFAEQIGKIVQIFHRLQNFCWWVGKPFPHRLASPGPGRGETVLCCVAGELWRLWGEPVGGGGPPPGNRTALHIPWTAAIISITGRLQAGCSSSRSAHSTAALQHCTSADLTAAATLLLRDQSCLQII